MALNMEAASSGSDIDAKDLLANKVNAGSSGATIFINCKFKSQSFER
jgi:hypothetical protein